jgi:hypothetical protein
LAGQAWSKGSAAKSSSTFTGASRWESAALSASCPARSEREGERETRAVRLNIDGGGKKGRFVLVFFAIVCLFVCLFVKESEERKREREREKGDERESEQKISKVSLSLSFSLCPSLK